MGKYHNLSPARVSFSPFDCIILAAKFTAHHSPASIKSKSQTGQDELSHFFRREWIDCSGQHQNWINVAMLRKHHRVKITNSEAINRRFSFSSRFCNIWFTIALHSPPNNDSVYVICFAKSRCRCRKLLDSSAIVETSMHLFLQASERHSKAFGISSALHNRFCSWKSE